MCSEVDKEPKFWRTFRLPRERTVYRDGLTRPDFNNVSSGKIL